MNADEAFVADRIEDALDGGVVDNYARAHLLSALAECDPDRAEQRRSHSERASGETIRGP